MTGYRAAPVGVRALLAWAGVTVAVALSVLPSVVDDTADAAHVQSSGSVIDRTYSCASVFLGGIRQIEARAHSGSRAHSEWLTLSYAVVASGGVARTPFVDAPPENSIAWVSAGRPSLATTVDDAWLSFTARAGGTIGVNRELCTPVSTRVPLTPRGLVGGAVGTHVAGFDCEVARRVLVRVRAVVDGGTALRERGKLFRVTNAPARVARLGVATSAGRVLVFADVSDSGRAKLFTARTCTPD